MLYKDCVHDHINDNSKTRTAWSCYGTFTSSKDTDENSYM